MKRASEINIMHDAARTDTTQTTLYFQYLLPQFPPAIKLTSNKFPLREHDVSLARPGSPGITLPGLSILVEVRF